jgi:glycosyltransferase involved in cell wall biosynthesis
LTIAGDGPERSRLEKMCRDLKIEKCVVFAGAVPQSALPALYRSAAVVVFPSIVAKGGDREGFGLVLVEALGCQCAVVVTDLPAMQDIVEDGKTGVVVAQKNPRKIADAVSRLLDDPALRERLGRAGRNHVLTRFDWMIIVRRYTEWINLQIGRPGRRDKSPLSGGAVTAGPKAQGPPPTDSTADR